MTASNRATDPLPTPLRFTRRAVIVLPAAVTIPLLAGNRPAIAQQVLEIVVNTDPNAAGAAFDRRDFGTVGIYDVDWLTTPAFSRLLDNLAASPDAFHGVRFFGAFTAGEREQFQPASGGEIWQNPDEPIDFTATFDALAALTSRGLTPFIALGFFPPAISPSPVTPPADWGRWKQLVRTFFEGLAADARFGADAIAEWWFEAWNEPNEGRFWLGTSEQYLELYRATSEAIAETGLAIRLGGPAIAYKPQVEPESGAPWIERFLRFVSENPEIRCDFISLHRKGTVTVDPPDPRRLYDAAATTAEQAMAIDPVRFAGLPIVNDEADEKVGFEVPFADRLNERNAAWLGAVTALHANLRTRYGVRFLAAADNANLQLVEAPFDGRRSLMTLARPGAPDDLLKVPAYGFYELLRLMGDRVCPVTSGAEQLFPWTDLYHLATSGEGGAACMSVYYPAPEDPDPQTRTVDYVVTGIPWSRVNIARFEIDRAHSNSFSAARGSPSNPYPEPDPNRLARIRMAQEISLVRPIEHNVTLADGTYQETLEIEPFGTVLLWITPAMDAIPAAPEWLETSVQHGDVVLRWSPNREPYFFSYEVVLVRNGALAERISPEPLRAAMWVETAPLAGPRSYAVRAVSASGLPGAFVASPEVVVER
jgi:hypothetical protein